MNRNKILLIITLLFITVTAVVVGIKTTKENTASSEEIVKEEILNPGTIREEKDYISNISIDYLQSLNIDSNRPVIEEELAPGSNYKRYIASYTSWGNKIYGLLTVPDKEAPKEGFKAIVFNHGYIPPKQYKTTQKYEAYVDYLARNDFVVFKIDLRGHGESEGEPTGSYFSPGYTVDAISALKSLQKLDYVDADGVGMWGHSMAGNLVLRAMLMEEDIKAAVIWSGAVYSYEDFAEYRLHDSSYVRRDRPKREEDDDPLNDITKEVMKIRENPDEIDFSNEFWSSISLTSNIEFLNSPIQLHHAVNDPVVDVGYSRDLAQVLEEKEKEYELYEYEGGGHNINSPYFEQAMQRTVEFFEENL